MGAAHFLLPRRGLKFVLVLASLLACGGFLFLAVSSPPAPAAWRLWGVLCIGFSTGLLNAGVFHAISPIYQIDRAATVNFAGLLFGSGSLLTALLVAGTYYVYTVPSILVLFAALPGLYAVVCYKGNFSRHPTASNASACRRYCAIFGILARCCSACCCSFNSAMNGRWRDGCRSF